MALFLGKYEYVLDSKGRVNIPARFRDQLPPNDKSLAIFNGLHPCLYLYPVADIDEITGKFENPEFLLDAEVQRLRSIMLNGASMERPDTQGRVMLSEEQRRYARLDRQLIIVGNIRRIEIWSPELYQGQMLNPGKESLRDLADQAFPHERSKRS